MSIRARSRSGVGRKWPPGPRVRHPCSAVLIRISLNLRENVFGYKILLQEKIRKIVGQALKSIWTITRSLRVSITKMVQGTNQNSSFRLLKTVKNRDTKAYFEKLQSHTHSHHASTTKNKTTRLLCLWKLLCVLISDWLRHHLRS